MFRAHKIRINPTPEQDVHFRKACGTARFVYNQGLDLWKFGKQVGIEEYGVMAIKRDLNSFKAEQFPWMLEVSKSVVEGALMNLGKALANYFDAKKGKRQGRQGRLPQVQKQERQAPIVLSGKRPLLGRGQHHQAPQDRTGEHG